MSDNIMNSRIVLCSKTTAAWATETIIAKKGEILIEWATENGVTIPRIKVGDGVNLFKDLPYVGVDLSALDNYVEDSEMSEITPSDIDEMFRGGDGVLPSILEDFVTITTLNTVLDDYVLMSDMTSYLQEHMIKDVQVAGTSILDEQGVANIGYPQSNGKPGVVLIDGNLGVGLNYGKTLVINTANDALIKNSQGTFKPITPSNQYKSVFYGLAKAAGSDEKDSTLPLGQYTESAKSAISEMLNGSVSVSGTAPTINALPGIRYVCGEVATLDITLPESGIVDVIFESGSTPTVLSVTPPTGMTMKWANGFDPTSLEADTTYEINIMDGCLGVAGSWT